MHQNSVVATDSDSCEYNQGGKDWWMLRDSFGTDDFDS